MTDLASARSRMVERHLRARGIVEPKLLSAFASVPRELFVPVNLVEFAYEDAPLPIGNDQTISQPYIVAVTVRALGLRGGERVLEVGAGSGYAAAILSRIAGEVFTIERIESLARSASERLDRLGYTNAHVILGDGSLGLPEHAPYAAIAVAAGGPKVPSALLDQLAIGGRLVIPVGTTNQVLKRITRTGPSSYDEESLMDVRFVPLVGEQGWSESDKAQLEEVPSRVVPRSKPSKASLLRAVKPQRGLSSLVREAAEPIDDIDTADVDALLDRIGDSRLVLLGEATHGTSEFYRLRARITRELIVRRGFDFVAVEADWPDAARVNDYVAGWSRRSSLQHVPFARFPTWMWRNAEVRDFAEWQRNHNAEHLQHRVGFYGLDLYSLYTSIAEVLAYLDGVDPAAASVARHRYGSLTPWQKDPAAYGRAVLVGSYRSSEAAVIATLRELLERRLEYGARDGERFFDATQNARLVANAERYYREMYYGSAMSWNLRDQHMFDTLRSLFAFYGPDAKGIVWEHNSHVGNAAATEMSARGEHNVGQLSRGIFGDRVYSIGFGTDHGTVAAASDWDGPMQVMRVVPARDGSYERICHDTGLPAFTLALRNPSRSPLRDELGAELLERAIGVIYRPQTEMESHYFYASLPRQFDEYVWIDETHAVRPLPPPKGGEHELPDTYPFGL